MFSKRVADGGLPDCCLFGCFPLFLRVDFFTLKLAALVKFGFLVNFSLPYQVR